MKNINEFIKNPKVKDTKFVQSWLYKELKILAKGINCTSTFYGKFKVKYNIFWESDDFGIIKEYKFSLLRTKNPVSGKCDNLLDLALVKVLNNAPSEDILHLVSIFPEYVKVNQRIKYCCKVADLLESIDDNYRWTDTLIRAKV